VVTFTTVEKGKKGNKFTWTRLIPCEEYRLLYNPNRFPLSEKELRIVRKALRYAYSEIMNKYPELFNADTKKYIVETGKVLHLWRHTAAREYLKAFHWNRHLVAKLLGWEKEDNLRIYGDYSALEIISMMAEKKEPHLPSFF
jgi:integrase